jgi:signal transduction histidine kinase
MGTLYNLDLFSLGIFTAAIGILGFVIFINDRQSSTNRAFFLFSLITIGYGVLNYLNYKVSHPVLVLWLLRFVLFSAVWHAFSMFHLFYTFPQKHIIAPLWYRRFLVPWVIFVSFVTLTPVMFSKILGQVVIGQVTNPERGPGMALFGVTVVGLVAFGIFFLILKTRRASQTHEYPYKLMLIGTFITFALLLTSNFILPVIFNVLSFVPLATVYFIPFILCTAYAIMRHHLLDVKIVTSEIFSGLLAVATFLEVIVAREPWQIFVRVIVFFLVLIFGVMLIRGVHREVEQRTILEKLTKVLRAANKKLRELDRIKSEFLSFASHQVKTPMTVVKGYASMIADGSFGAAPEEVIKVSKEIEQSADTMIALVNNLLDYRKLEEGRMDFSFEPVKVGEFVFSCVEAVRQLAVIKGLELSFISHADDVMADIDRQKFQQVIQNLVENSIKYTEKGSVSVSIDKVEEKHEIKIAVTDTGYGMEASLLPQLFSQFTRGKGETKKIRGTGLGLYIAKQIVLNHKGRILAESQGEGKGSTFTVFLPVP